MYIENNIGIEFGYEVMCNGNVLLFLYFLKVLKYIFEIIYC